MSLPLRLGHASTACEVLINPLIAWAALAHLEVVMPILRDNCFFSKEESEKRVFEVGATFVEVQSKLHVGVYPPGRIELVEAIPGKLLRYQLRLARAGAYFGLLDKEELVFKLMPAADGKCRIKMTCHWCRVWVPVPLLVLAPLALPMAYSRVKSQQERLRTFLKQNNRPSRINKILLILDQLKVPIPPDVPTIP